MHSEIPVLRRFWCCAALVLGVVWAGCATRSRFSDDFRQGLGPGWRILREDPAAWRPTDDGLAIRVLPGNMWGGANDARNTLVHPAPNPIEGPVEVTVEVENRPTEQYEQVDLVWYYGDGYQVKIGQERVDGKLCIVMGREEADRTRTIAILPLETFRVELRQRVEGSRVRGFYRPAGETAWREAGECEAAIPPGAPAPSISLQAYQGPGGLERWARLRGFRVEQGRVRE